MTSGDSGWWTSWSASVTVFVGLRLNALGKVIVHELERSYAGWFDNHNSRERKSPEIPADTKLPFGQGGKDLGSKNHSGCRPPLG
jgi:hypothetical protein